MPQVSAVSLLSGDGEKGSLNVGELNAVWKDAVCWLCFSVWLNYLI